MSGRLPRNSLRTAMKERLRGARFLARELRESVSKAGRFEGRAAYPGAAVVGAIADASDTALSKLESVALGFISADPEAHFGPASARSLDAYFGSGGADSQDNFARDLYFAAKDILTRKGVGNPGISEAAFGQAYRQAVDALDGPVDPAGAKDLSALCVAAATVAQSISAAHPIVSPALIEDAPPGAIYHANLYVAVAVSLALAVASFNDRVGPEDDVYGAAMAALDVRYSAVEAAVRSPTPVELLARIFEELTPRLP